MFYPISERPSIYQAEIYVSIVRIYHIYLHVLLLTDTWFEFVLALVDNAAVGRVLQISQDLAFSSFGDIPKSGVPGAYGYFIFNFLRNHQTVFISSYTTLNSY